MPSSSAIDDVLFAIQHIIADLADNWGGGLVLAMDSDGLGKIF